MNDITASLVFGAALVLLGAFLIRWHRAAWRSQRDDPELEPRDRQHFQAQFRRRVQVAILLILLGVLIPVGDALIVQRKNPQWITALLIAILMVALWIMALGAADWLSNRIHFRSTRAALAGLAQKRRELEAEVERLRKQRSNGREP